MSLGIYAHIFRCLGPVRNCNGMQVSLGLAEAVVTALVTANNYSVTVEYNGNSNSVNASEVANVFLAGLQDAVTPCAMNVSSTTNATSGSAAYFEDIATV